MSPFEQAYPHIARWVESYGWIEIGDDGMGRSWIRALDEGGLIWEGERVKTVDDALRALEAALDEWMREQLGE